MREMRAVNHSDAVLIARNGKGSGAGAKRGRTALYSSASASASSSSEPLLGEPGGGRGRGREAPSGQGLPDKALTLDYLREEWQAMRESQSELEVSLQRYADLYDLAPVGYLSLTRSGCIREINLTGARMLGLTRGQLIGGHLLTLIAVPDRRRYLSHLTRLRRGQPQSSTEVEIVNPSGRVGVMQLISAISHSNETGAKLFHTAMVDITERRQAEEGLRQARDELEIRVRERTADLTLANEALNAAVGAHRKAEAALRVSQARLQAILDHSSSLIFLKNMQGRYLLVNRRFEEVFHYSSAQVVGKTDTDIFPPHQAPPYRANTLTTS